MKIHAAIVLVFSLGILALRTAATTYYVDINSPNPTPPYTNWSTASTNIQSAIDQSSPGDLVLVNDGVYRTGAETINGHTSLNRVAINRTITLQSVNGPATTIIRGYQTNAIRCVYMTNNATLIGFTLTGGAAFNYENDYDGCGGGIWCEPGNAAISNCVIVGNSATRYGGGAFRGFLNNCLIASNLDVDGFGGGVYGDGVNPIVLNDCIISNNTAGWGGGVFGSSSLPFTNCILNNCIIVSNTVDAEGGGVDEAQLNNCIIIGNGGTDASGGGGAYAFFKNCLLVDNTAVDGGGASSSTLINCTIAYNDALQSENGGGMESSAADSCIIYYNTSGGFKDNYFFGTETNCDTVPLPPGLGNFTNSPSFINLTNNFHLQSNSPCINAGNNTYVTTATDLDGNPRIVGGTVDIGCYEYQSPVSMVSYQWLEQYGLPITNDIDTSSPNGTGFDVYQDWIAGLNPTNPASVLAMMSPPATNNSSGITVTWQSVGGINYNLLRSTNLAAPFITIQANIPGQSGTTSYTDTSATNNVPYFYRVGVP